ncbi:hypothetical protein L1887_39179 [Cichorium endivia]|nr:hypothetical protein L1887_39179 [Cichorium endivia]
MVNPPEFMEEDGEEEALMCKGRPGFVPGVEVDVFVPGFDRDVTVVSNWNPADLIGLMRSDSKVRLVLGSNRNHEQPQDAGENALCRLLSLISVTNRRRRPPTFFSSGDRSSVVGRCTPFSSSRLLARPPLLLSLLTVVLAVVLRAKTNNLLHRFSFFLSPNPTASRENGKTNRGCDIAAKFSSVFYFFAGGGLS